MSSPLQRPAFYESQILAAADLAEVVRYARNQLARHERLLHEWGIVQGLELVLGSGGASLLVKAGAAIDGTGRETVVPADYSVPASSFTLGVSDATAACPVFLVGRDGQVAAASTLSGLCTQAEPSRVGETYQVEFGNPGDEQGLDEQPAPADLGADPGGGPGDGTPWRVLLGFVQWNTEKGVFAAALAESPGGGRRRYAGVRADDVSARGTRLTLGTSGGGLGKPRLTLTETDGGGLEFRLAGAADPPLLSLNAKGDLAISGKFTTVGQPAGQVRVESGTVFDGALLPLPSGITREMVDKGDVTLHVQLTPRLVPPTPLPDRWTARPRSCFVDDHGRVNCTVAWAKAGPLGAIRDGSSACDFTVMAVFPPTSR